MAGLQELAAMKRGAARRAFLVTITVVLLGGCTLAPIAAPTVSAIRSGGPRGSPPGAPKGPGTAQAGHVVRQSPRVVAVTPIVRSPASEGTEPAHASLAPASPAATLAAVRVGPQGLEDAWLQRLREQAEAAYQGRQAQVAIEAFAMLVEFDPQDGRAWLRLGNLYQRKPDVAAAARAYRRAADLGGDGRQPREIRQKALLNLTLLGIERSRQALAELDRERLEPVLADARADVREQLAELVRGIDTALARPPAAAAPDPPPAVDTAVAGPADAAVPGPPTGPRPVPRVTLRRADMPSRRPGGAGDAVTDAARGEGPVRVDYLQGRPAR